MVAKQRKGTGKTYALIARTLQEGNLYAVLGVETTADYATLNKAYKKLALKLHPDKCHLENAGEAFKAINSAYATLKDTDKRSFYDANQLGRGKRNERDDDDDSRRQRRRGGVPEGFETGWGPDGTYMPPCADGVNIFEDPQHTYKFSYGKFVPTKRKDNRSRQQKAFDERLHTARMAPGSHDYDGSLQASASVMLAFCMNKLWNLSVCGLAGYTVYYATPWLFHATVGRMVPERILYYSGPDPTWIEFVLCLGTWYLMFMWILSCMELLDGFLIKSFGVDIGAILRELKIPDPPAEEQHRHPRRRRRQVPKMRHWTN